MANIIEFKSIEKDDIFCDDFKNLINNNKIDFSKKKISIIYAPNGTGKTSLSKILDFEKGTNFELNYNKKIYSTQNGKRLFHRISDQNARNIIKGETGDFILGDDIKKERELKKQLDDGFYKLFNELLIPNLKDIFNISKQSSLILKNIIKEPKIKEYISLLVNKKNKGNDINYAEFISEIEKLRLTNEQVVNEDKFKYFIIDYENSNSILRQIINIKEEKIEKNDQINVIQENELAIDILEEYKDKHQCIVCDSKIDDPDKLIEHKRKNKESIYEKLDDYTKTILEKIITKIEGNDPFNIKEILFNAISEGNKTYLEGLQNEITECINLYIIKINNFFCKCFDGLNLKVICKEYEKMLNKPLKLETEDICYIQEVINENIDKKIILERNDKNHEIQIKLDDKVLLETERDELHLSTGEQNFISLAFELLKARNVKEEIIIIDDPISSFDSIYKNKIAFAIIKFLDKKKQIVLTHNTELIKLLEYQQQGCFNLYLLNNVPSEINGFIHINSKEEKLLLNLNELINFFRMEVYDCIKNEKLFMISLIPFMRGYANIIGDSVSYKRLSKLMHGYEKGNINVTIIYNKLFKDIKNGKKIVNKYSVSVKEILKTDITDSEIIDSSIYPLLNKTLHHSLLYLYLRLYVEKNLIDLFITGDIPKNYMLAQVIKDAFKGNEQEKIEQRVFFNSRKTLLNEFNHFEGNMNIFQPAIDISEDSLEKEKNAIINRINGLKMNK